MARSAAEIEESLANSISLINPGMQTRTGDIRLGYIRPFSREFGSIEAQIAILQQLYSLDLSSADSDQRLEQVALHFGLQRRLGKPSGGFVVLCTARRPASSDVLTARAGSIVGTIDGSLAYQVTDTRQLPGSNADAFLIAARRRFELRVPVEALAVGEDHDVPPATIREILSSIDDFNVVDNLEALTGGKSRETNAALASRIQQRFLGIDRGVNGGLIEEGLRFDDTVLDVVPVFNTDFALFRRRITRPAIDLYVDGAYDREVTDTLTAVGGETAFLLTQQTVASILTVTLNGTATPFSWSRDGSRETGGSTIALDRIVLPAPLAPGDQLEVAYVTNGLLLDMQAAVDEEGESSRFGTSILLRSKRAVLIEIMAQLHILGSFSEITVTNDVATAIETYITTAPQRAALVPEELRDLIVSTVAGVSRVSFPIFRRIDGGPNFGVVTIAKNEKSTTTQALLRVATRR